MVALSELGANIGPVLAGAGVAGIAVGFGAQKLVQDVISGLFILIEDRVAVGDVVRIAGHAGTVEALSLRAITLRDLSGTVHVIPFGSVDTLENMVKDYSYALLDVGVGYGEDVDRVTGVIEEVAASVAKDPRYRNLILAPLEVLGVQLLADSAVVICIRIQTRPAEQYGIRRELKRWIKQAFDASGIEIPFPQRSLHIHQAPQSGG